MNSFDTPWFQQQDRSFFNTLNKSSKTHILLTAETADFAEEVTQQWKDEGFNVVYVPLEGSGSAAQYVARVKQEGEALGVSEQYAVVAFGDAAALVLESHIKPQNPKCCALIAYYPNAIPPPMTKYPGSIRVMIHLAGSEIGVRTTHEVLGIQSSKKKTVKKRIDPGAGNGGTLKLAAKAFTYDCESGFAEHDLEEFNAIAERLAFSRSLACVKRAFRLEENLDTIRDEISDLALDADENPKPLTARLHSTSHSLFAPTLSGGAGASAITAFYQTHYFLPRGAKTQLLSRTLDASRCVDELYISLTHSCEIPWLLPNIPATNRKIEIAVVSIVCLRGGKLESEHVYWDQGSVLMQAGLIDVKNVPEGMKKKGVKRLPVVGAEGARAARRGSTREFNSMVEKKGGEGKK
ncbi:hypothetical protein B0A48_03116 [Cryoendolithus antarcticus]|uniref:Dienelactone hydrolase domain-containing protein n=1 Tax=Cryoendolithus antarcticus TaxID=1507870 RepID=A0A1V8TMD8_9PEZI|nr:hypothetical protein B0A48_03116 [Cryoendolithus antarcticus]